MSDIEKQPSKVYYDRIVKIELFRLKVEDTSTTEDDKDKPDEYDPVTDETAPDVYEEEEETTDEEGGETEEEEISLDDIYDAEVITVDCDAMGPKPNIRVSFKAIPGGITYDMTVTILNFIHSINLMDYVFMRIYLGYRISDIPLMGTIGSDVIQISGPILTAYQVSPNPDGETVFKSIITGEYLGKLTQNPIYIKLYETLVNPIIGYDQETDSDGEVISFTPVYDQVESDSEKVTEMRVPLKNLMYMVACCITKGTFFFDPVEKDTYTTDPFCKMDELAATAKKSAEENKTSFHLEVIMNIPNFLKEFELDVTDLASSSMMSLYSLIKRVEELINTQITKACKEIYDFDIQMHLVIFNDKLILTCTGGSAVQKNLPKTVLRYVYSMTYQGPILHVTAPFYPSVYPGSFVQVYPGFYDGSAVLRAMGDVTQYSVITEKANISEEETDNPVKHHIYVVLTMSVDFGSCEGNTMELLCVPVLLRAEDAERLRRLTGNANYLEWLNEQRKNWKGNQFWSQLVYGKPPEQTKATNALANVIYDNSDGYDWAPYQVFDTLSDVSKHVLCWNGYWNCAEFARQERKGDSSFVYITDLYIELNAIISTVAMNNSKTTEFIPIHDPTYSDSAITKGDFIVIEKANFNVQGTSRWSIPMCEFWPMIVCLSTTVWMEKEGKDDKTNQDTEWLNNYPLAYDRTCFDPDILIFGNYIALPYAFSLGLNGVENMEASEVATAMAEKEASSEKSRNLYKTAGVYALERLIDGKCTYQPWDVEHLLNIYIFLGGSYDDVISDVKQLIENRKQAQEERNKS